MPRRIVIVSGIQISTNPRVVKEADSLSANGYDVVVLGATLNPTLARRDRDLVAGKAWKYETLLDSSATDFTDRANWLFARIRLRFWAELRRKFGISGYRQLGYAGPEMLVYCLAQPADLYIVHNPQSTWVGRELIARGLPVAADIEDWYSEDLLPENRRSVPTELLRECERAVLKEGKYSSTTSKALSDELARAFDCRTPVVVYNSFPSTERAALDGKTLDRKDTTLPSLVWFSQVAAYGRGLETLIDALGGVQRPFEIHIRGSSDESYKQALLMRAPAEWRGRIYFHPQVAHAELLSRLAEHDIGFAGDLPSNKSRDLTVTNKILQYLLAGLPVVASDTSGHREVAIEAPLSVSLFTAGDHASLATTLDRLLEDRAALRDLRSQSIAAAEGIFSWEESARRLVATVRESIGS